MCTQLIRFLVCLLSLVLVSGCVATRPSLTYQSGARLETLASSVSLSLTTGEGGMSGTGYLVYRRPDQVHLIMQSPFGSILFEVFVRGDRVTLLYPDKGVALIGTLNDLPARAGLDGWRLLGWVMDADALSSQPGRITRDQTGYQNIRETATFDNGMLVEKKRSTGELVFYSDFVVVNGIPFATEIDLRNDRNEQIRLVFDEPEVNTVLEDTAFQPHLDGYTVRPLAEIQ